MRKTHLQHTVKYGPACQGGRSGGAISGEHITVGYNSFANELPQYQCAKCVSSKLFSFLARQGKPCK